MLEVGLGEHVLGHALGAVVGGGLLSWDVWHRLLVEDRLLWGVVWLLWLHGRHVVDRLRLHDRSHELRGSEATRLVALLDQRLHHRLGVIVLLLLRVVPEDFRASLDRRLAIINITRLRNRRILRNVGWILLVILRCLLVHLRILHWVDTLLLSGVERILTIEGRLVLVLIILGLVV